MPPRKQTQAMKRSKGAAGTSVLANSARDQKKKVDQNDENIADSGTWLERLKLICVNTDMVESDFELAVSGWSRGSSSRNFRLFISKIKAQWRCFGHLGAKDGMILDIEDLISCVSKVNMHTTFINLFFPRYKSRGPASFIDLNDIKSLELSAANDYILSRQNSSESIETLENIARLYFKAHMADINALESTPKENLNHIDQHLSNFIAAKCPESRSPDISGLETIFTKWQTDDNMQQQHPLRLALSSFRMKGSGSVSDSGIGTQITYTNDPSSSSSTNGNVANAQKALIFVWDQLPLCRDELVKALTQKVAKEAASKIDDDYAATMTSDPAVRAKKLQLLALRDPFSTFLPEYCHFHCGKRMYNTSRDQPIVNAVLSKRSRTELRIDNFFTLYDDLHRDGFQAHTIPDNAYTIFLESIRKYRMMHWTELPSPREMRESDGFMRALCANQIAHGKLMLRDVIEQMSEDIRKRGVATEGEVDTVRQLTSICANTSLGRALRTVLELCEGILCTLRSPSYENTKTLKAKYHEHYNVTLCGHDDVSSCCGKLLHALASIVDGTSRNNPPPNQSLDQNYTNSYRIWYQGLKCHQLLIDVPSINFYMKIHDPNNASVGLDGNYTMFTSSGADTSHNLTGSRGGGKTITSKSLQPSLAGANLVQGTFPDASAPNSAADQSANPTNQINQSTETAKMPNTNDPTTNPVTNPYFNSSLNNFNPHHGKQPVSQAHNNNNGGVSLSSTTNSGSNVNLNNNNSNLNLNLNVNNNNNNLDNLNLNSLSSGPGFNLNNSNSSNLSSLSNNNNLGSESHSHLSLGNSLNNNLSLNVNVVGASNQNSGSNTAQSSTVTNTNAGGPMQPAFGASGSNQLQNSVNTPPGGQYQNQNAGPMISKAAAVNHIHNNNNNAAAAAAAAITAAAASSPPILNQNPNNAAAQTANSNLNANISSNGAANAGPSSNGASTTNNNANNVTVTVNSNNSVNQNLSSGPSNQKLNFANLDPRFNPMCNVLIGQQNNPMAGLYDKNLIQAAAASNLNPKSVSNNSSNTLPATVTAAATTGASVTVSTPKVANPAVISHIATPAANLNVNNNANSGSGRSPGLSPAPGTGIITGNVLVSGTSSVSSVTATNTSTAGSTTNTATNSIQALDTTSQSQSLSLATNQQQIQGPISISGANAPHNPNLGNNTISNTNLHAQPAFQTSSSLNAGPAPGQVNASGPNGVLVSQTQQVAQSPNLKLVNATNTAAAAANPTNHHNNNNINFNLNLNSNLNTVAVNNSNMKLNSNPNSNAGQSSSATVANVAAAPVPQTGANNKAMLNLNLKLNQAPNQNQVHAMNQSQTAQFSNSLQVNASQNPNNNNNSMIMSMSSISNLVTAVTPASNLSPATVKAAAVPNTNSNTNNVPATVNATVPSINHQAAATATAAVMHQNQVQAANQPQATQNPNTMQVNANQILNNSNINLNPGTGPGLTPGQSFAAATAANMNLNSSLGTSNSNLNVTATNLGLKPNTVHIAAASSNLNSQHNLNVSPVSNMNVSIPNVTNVTPVANNSSVGPGSGNFNTNIATNTGRSQGLVSPVASGSTPGHNLNSNPNNSLVTNLNLNVAVTKAVSATSAPTNILTTSPVLTPSTAADTTSLAKSQQQRQRSNSMVQAAANAQQSLNNSINSEANLKLKLESDLKLNSNLNSGTVSESTAAVIATPGPGPGPEVVTVPGHGSNLGINSASNLSSTANAGPVPDPVNVSGQDGAVAHQTQQIGGSMTMTMPPYATNTATAAATPTNQQHSNNNNVDMNLNLNLGISDTDRNPNLNSTGASHSSAGSSLAAAVTHAAATPNSQTMANSAAHNAVMDQNQLQATATNQPQSIKNLNSMPVNANQTPTGISNGAIGNFNPVAVTQTAAEPHSNTITGPATATVPDSDPNAASAATKSLGPFQNQTQNHVQATTQHQATQNSNSMQVNATQNANNMNNGIVSNPGPVTVTAALPDNNLIASKFNFKFNNLHFNNLNSNGNLNSSSLPDVAVPASINVNSGSGPVDASVTSNTITNNLNPGPAAAAATAPSLNANNNTVATVTVTADSSESDAAAAASNKSEPNFNLDSNLTSNAANAPHQPLPATNLSRKMVISDMSYYGSEYNGSHRSITEFDNDMVISDFEDEVQVPIVVESVVKNAAPEVPVINSDSSSQGQNVTQSENNPNLNQNNTSEAPLGIALAANSTNLASKSNNTANNSAPDETSVIANEMLQQALQGDANQQQLPPNGINNTGDANLNQNHINYSFTNTSADSDSAIKAAAAANSISNTVTVTESDGAAIGDVLKNDIGMGLSANLDSNKLNQTPELSSATTTVGAATPVPAIVSSAIGIDINNKANTVTVTPETASTTLIAAAASKNSVAEVNNPNVGTILNLSSTSAAAAASVGEEVVNASVLKQNANLEPAANANVASSSLNHNENVNLVSSESQFLDQVQFPGPGPSDDSFFGGMDQSGLNLSQFGQYNAPVNGSSEHQALTQIIGDINGAPTNMNLDNGVPGGIFSNANDNINMNLDFNQGDTQILGNLNESYEQIGGDLIHTGMHMAQTQVIGGLDEDIDKLSAIDAVHDNNQMFGLSLGSGGVGGDMNQLEYLAQSQQTNEAINQLNAIEKRGREFEMDTGSKRQKM